MTFTGSSNQFAFRSTSATTRNITSNGLTFTRPVSINGIGGTFQFTDAFTQSSSLNFGIVNGTVEFKNGVTHTIGSLSSSGTNQKFLQSSLAGSHATANMSYLTIKDINATGGARFNAVTGSLSGGNNNGWYFAYLQNRAFITRGF
jgi:hypothetical protein